VADPVLLIDWRQHHRLDQVEFGKVESHKRVLHCHNALDRDA
jgi:hypothetical protein